MKSILTLKCQLVALFSTLDSTADNSGGALAVPWETAHTAPEILWVGFLREEFCLSAADGKVREKLDN